MSAIKAMKANAALSRISALALGAVVALGGLATASAQEATDEVGSQVTSFGVGDWLNLGLRLALVIGVIWAAVHGMRWYVRRMNRGGSRGGIRALEVLETHTLGPNRTLHLVRLGDRAVLVGATQERITQLLTVDDPEEFKRIVETPDDDAELDIVTRTARTAPGLSVFSALRTGLVAIRANQVQMSERIKAQREVEREARGEQRLARRKARTRPAAKQAPEAADLEQVDDAPADAKGPRFGALKGVLGRAQRPSRAPRPAPRTSEEIIEAAAEERESLFDRALASIDAIEVTQNSSIPGSTAAGARARASYGAARGATGGASGRSSLSAGRTREAQLADLQRAIEQARKSAS